MDKVWPLPRRGSLIWLRRCCDGTLCTDQNEQWWVITSSGRRPRERSELLPLSIIAGATLSSDVSYWSSPEVGSERNCEKSRPSECWKKRFSGTLFCGKSELRRFSQGSYPVSKRRNTRYFWTRDRRTWRRISVYYWPEKGDSCWWRSCTFCPGKRCRQ